MLKKCWRILIEGAAGIGPGFVVGPDAGGGEVNDGGEEHGPHNIVGVVDAHAEYHKAHEEGGGKEAGFEPHVPGAQEVDPDAGDVAGEEEVFGEGAVVGIDGILEEEVAEDDHAGGGLEGDH